MIRKLTTPEESVRANELFAIAFEQPMTRPCEPDDAGTHRWAAFDDQTGEMTSNLVVSDFSIRFDGGSCKMGGIGGVASLPQYRRCGGIRGCFEALLPDMYENGYDFSYLYPFSTGYYRKFGYECCVQKYHTAVDLALLNPPKTDGFCKLVEPGRPLVDDIRAIDAVWESRYNMMVIHGEDDYKWTEKVDPAVKLEFTYVYYSADGSPKAYATFAKADGDNGRNLVCSRFFFIDREGFSGLMALFKSLSADHRFVIFTLPTQTAMQYLMPEWSQGAVAWDLQNAGMVRVINVKRVLEKAAYVGDGAVTLRICDQQIRQNDRTFAVRFAGGRAVSVEETAAPADLELSIAAFSALIAGTCDFAEAKCWMNGIKVSQNDAVLPQIFYRKPLMIADYF